MVVQIKILLGGEVSPALFGFSDYGFRMFGSECAGFWCRVRRGRSFFREELRERRDEIFWFICRIATESFFHCLNRDFLDWRITMMGYASWINIIHCKLKIIWAEDCPKIAYYSIASGLKGRNITARSVRAGMVIWESFWALKGRHIFREELRERSEEIFLCRGFW